VRWLRRRDETLNEQLLREAGYLPDGTEAAAASTDDKSAGGILQLPGINATSSVAPGEDQIVTTVEVSGLAGDSYAFTALPDGSLIVDESCNEDLSPLADAVEQHLEPPYHASATRQSDTVWAIAARPMKVAQFVADGDELELTSVAGKRTYTVDGRGVDETLAPPTLASLGEARSDDYAVHATRLDGDLWQVEPGAL
jgi:hypothetical protein